MRRADMCLWVLLATLALPADGASARTGQATGASAPQPATREATDGAELKSLLGLRPEQEAAAGAYLATVHAPWQGVMISDAQYNGMTEPNRAHALAANLAVSARQAATTAAATDAFYGQLDASQKQAFDKATSVHVPSSAVAAAPSPREGELGSSVDALGYTAPAWLTQPTGDILERLYPDGARTKLIPGRSKISCTVDRQGYLRDCVVVEEDPSGMGFGNAALEATGYMRLTPALRYGRPREAKVTVPVAFVLLK